MATITKGKTFISGETVEPNDMHQLVDAATIAFSAADDTDNSTLEVSGNKFRVKVGGIVTASLADISVTDLKISSSAVTESKIASSAVTEPKIASGAVAQAKLAANVVGNGPAFRAYANSVTTVATATFSKVTLLEDYDTNNNFASSRFTPTVAGYYQINGAVFVSAGTTAQSLVAAVYKNGAVAALGSQINTGTSISTVSDLIYLNGVSDYVELYAWHNAGADRTIASSYSSTYLSGCLVRSA